MFKNHGPGGCCCGGNEGFGCLVCSDQFTQRTDPSDIGSCVTVENYEVSIGEDCLKPIQATPFCSVNLPWPRSPKNRTSVGTRNVYFGLLESAGYGNAVRNSRTYELDISPVDGNSFFVISSESRTADPSGSQNDIGIGIGKVGYYKTVVEPTGAGVNQRVFDWSGSWNLSDHNDGYAYDEPSFYWEENMILRIEISTHHNKNDLNASSTPASTIVPYSHINCMRVYINDSLVAQTGIYDFMLNSASPAPAIFLRTPEKIWYYEGGLEREYHGKPSGIKVNSVKIYDDYGTSSCNNEAGGELTLYCQSQAAVVDSFGLYPNPPEAESNCSYSNPAYFFWGLGDDFPPLTVDATFSGAGVTKSSGTTDSIANGTYTLYRNGYAGSVPYGASDFDRWETLVRRLYSPWFYSREWDAGTGPVVTRSPGPVIFDIRVRRMFLWPLYAEFNNPLSDGFVGIEDVANTCPPNTLLCIYVTETGPLGGGGPWTIGNYSRVQSYGTQLSSITSYQDNATLSPWYQEVVGGGTDNATGTVTLQF